MQLRAEEAAHLAVRFERLLGKSLVALLERDDVSDVMVNADGHVWVERVGERVEDTGLRLGAAETTALVKTTATLTGHTVSSDSPVLETRVRGLRFEGLLPPVVAAPVVSIRKPARQVMSLRSYVERGEMSAAIYEALRQAVADRRNILVVGGTGSGKTTLANALLLELSQLCPHDRLVVIEDTRELQTSSRNVVAMESTAAADMAALLRASLRLRPDRIVVGEVRGAEALVLTKAWNTGHPGGICTIHADSAAKGLHRVEQMAAEGTAGHVPRHEVAQAVHVLVFVARRDGRRRVDELVRVNGLGPDGGYACEETVR